MAYRPDQTIVGYGVFRTNPWHLAGVFCTRRQAEAKASQLGSDYQVRWGENRDAIQDFVVTEGEARQG
jgi:hypothetical protein